eukprot:scaffold8759_cov135-Isochrysis_galbana.AAC.7
MAQLDELPSKRCILQYEWPPGEAALDDDRERLTGGAQQVGDGQGSRPVGASVAMDEHAATSPRASGVLTHKAHRIRQVQTKQLVPRDVLTSLEGTVRNVTLHIQWSAVMGSGRSTVQDCCHAKLH